MSNSLRPHELQHARPPCPSPSPEVYSNSCPSSRWCQPAISSSVIPFSSCPQSLPASGSFPMSQLFAWGGHKYWTFSPQLIITKSFGIQSLFHCSHFQLNLRCIIPFALYLPSTKVFSIFIKCIVYPSKCQRKSLSYLLSPVNFSSYTRYHQIFLQEYLFWPPLHYIQYWIII